MTLWTLWLLTIVLWAQARALPQESQETSALHAPNKDLGRMMDDERVFKEYYQCLVDLGPCTRDTKKFKEFIQEALERGCARCSSAQRKEAIKLLRMVMECRPREYAEIEKQFDPTGAFKNKYKMSLLARRFFA